MGENVPLILPPAPDTYRYGAFISYRHVEPDRKWAKWLHTTLETYRVPRRIVRDRNAPGALAVSFEMKKSFLRRPSLNQKSTRHCVNRAS